MSIIPAPVLVVATSVVLLAVGGLVGHTVLETRVRGEGVAA